MFIFIVVAFLGISKLVLELMMEGADVVNHFERKSKIKREHDKQVDQFVISAFMAIHEREKQRQ